MAVRAAATVRLSEFLSLEMILASLGPVRGSDKLNGFPRNRLMLWSPWQNISSVFEVGDSGYCSILCGLSEWSQQYTVQTEHQHWENELDFDEMARVPYQYNANQEPTASDRVAYNRPYSLDSTLLSVCRVSKWGSAFKCSAWYSLLLLLVTLSLAFLSILYSSYLFCGP